MGQPILSLYPARPCKTLARCPLSLPVCAGWAPVSLEVVSVLGFPPEPSPRAALPTAPCTPIHPFASAPAPRASGVGQLLVRPTSLEPGRSDFSPAVLCGSEALHL